MASDELFTRIDDRLEHSERLLLGRLDESDEETRRAYTEQLGLTRAVIRRNGEVFQLQAEAFGRQAEAFGRQAEAFGRHAEALERIMNRLDDLGAEVRAQTQAIFRMIDRLDEGPGRAGA